jgi:hypothetical protein
LGQKSETLVISVNVYSLNLAYTQPFIQWNVAKKPQNQQAYQVIARQLELILQPFFSEGWKLANTIESILDTTETGVWVSLGGLINAVYRLNRVRIKLIRQTTENK